MGSSLPLPLPSVIFGLGWDEEAHLQRDRRRSERVKDFMVFCMFWAEDKRFWREAEGLPCRYSTGAQRRRRMFQARTGVWGFVLSVIIMSGAEVRHSDVGMFLGGNDDLFLGSER